MVYAGAYTLVGERRLSAAADAAIAVAMVAAAAAGSKILLDWRAPFERASGGYWVTRSGVARSLGFVRGDHT